MEKLNKEGLLRRIEITKEMFEEAHKDMENAISNLNCIEREVRESVDEKMFYIPLTESSSNYINLNRDTGEIILVDKVESFNWQTTFTEAEIKAMPNGEAYWLLREPVEGED